MNFLLLVIPTLVSGRILFPFEIEELQRRGGFSSSAITFSSSETTTEPSETATTTMNIDTTTIRGEDMQETTTPSVLVAICPDGDFWCSTPLEYPDRAILKAVNKQKRTFKEMFDTKLEKENFAMSENETLISTRNSFVEYEEEFTNICDVKTSYITPRAAKNKDGKFRFIVNHPDGDDEYIQLVRVAVCSGAGAGAGVETRCQQEFSDHKLVTLGESGEELVVDTFSFPSCCTCLIGSDFLL